MNSNSSKISTKQSNLFIIAAYASLFVLGLSDNMRGPVLPDLQHSLGLNDFQGSWFFLVASLGGWACALGARLWLSRWHPYHVLVFWMAIHMLALFSLGLAPTYAWLLVAGAWMGGSMGILGQMQNILPGWGSGRHSVATQRRIYAGLHTMYGLSALLAPVLVTALYSLGVSWAKVFWFAGGLCGLATVGLFRAGRNMEFSQRVHLPPLWQKGQWQKVLVVGTIVGLYVATEVMVSSRVVLYLRRDLNWPLEAANTLLTVFFALLCLGRLAFALVPFPCTSRWLLIASILSSAAALVLALTVHPLFFAISGLTLSVFFPCWMAFLREEYDGKADYMVSFAMMCSPMALISMHAGVGLASDFWGLRAAFALGPVMCLLVFLLVFWGPFHQKISWRGTKAAD